MIDFFAKLFATDFMPHGFCLRTPVLIGLNAVSDGLIAVAYFLIPFGLLQLVRRRRDLEFHWMFVLFAAFILSCGATHLMSIVTLWTPVYRFDVVIKIVTAIASLPTAILLMKLVPQIATLPSPEQWRNSNEELKAEVAQRRSAEEAMLSLNAVLERRVNERTREIEAQNVQMQELKAAWDLAHGLIRDFDGRITFWCEGSQQQYGWHKGEAIGRISHELLQTEFPASRAEIEAELVQSGTWSGELVHLTKSGERLHVAAHWVLRRALNGRLDSVIEVNNDSSDRLRAQEAMQRLADLVESSEDAIMSSTLEGAITSWNKSAEVLFGYQAAEVLGRPIEMLTPLARREKDSKLLREMGVGGGANRFETVWLSKKGKEIEVAVTVSPIRNSLGQVIGTSQIVHDISEAKAAAEAVRLSEERQRLAVDAGQVGLWYLEVESGKSIWTQRCKEMHGLGVDTAVPEFKAILNLVHADDREVVKAAMERTIGEGADLAVDYRTRGLDFRTKWIQARGMAQRDPNGKVIGVHGTVIDLTARREMEDKLRRVNTELEQFAYAAAHDLQEPLRNVALAAALLQTEQTAAQEEKSDGRLLTLVVDNARRMEAMVKDLLAYSRSVEAAESHWSARASGQTALNQVLENLSATIQEKQAVITSDPVPRFVCRKRTWCRYFKI